MVTLGNEVFEFLVFDKNCVWLSDSFRKQWKTTIQFRWFYWSFIVTNSICRPFGVSAILVTADKEGPKLHMIEPSGLGYVSKTRIDVNVFDTKSH